MHLMYNSSNSSCISSSSISFKLSNKTAKPLGLSNTPTSYYFSNNPFVKLPAYPCSMNSLIHLIGLERKLTAKSVKTLRFCPCRSFSISLISSSTSCVPEKKRSDSVLMSMSHFLSGGKGRNFAFFSSNKLTSSYTRNYLRVDMRVWSG